MQLGSDLEDLLRRMKVKMAIRTVEPVVRQEEKETGRMVFVERLSGQRTTDNGQRTAENGKWITDNLSVMLTLSPQLPFSA